MSYFLMVLFAGLIVAADQFTKYLTVHNLSPYACRGMENFSVYFDKLCSSYHIEPSMYDTMTTKTPVVNNVFSFTHIFNDGGAWGMFNGAIWLFVVIFALFAAFMVLARLVSGVHWVTDIIGGLLLSAGLVFLYRGITE